jgi:hypothetical protein
MNTFFSYLKIGMALIASYVVVVYFSDVLFIGNSPLIRTHPEQYLAQKINTQTSSLLALFQNKTPSITADDYRNFMSTATAETLKQIAPGTYAATINGNNVQIFKPSEVSSTETTYKLNNGIEQKVSYQAGSNPPTQAEIERASQLFTEYQRSHQK